MALKASNGQLDPSAQTLTLMNVWRKTLQMSRQHGSVMIRALLLPVGKMLLGLYGSMGLSLWFVQWVTQPERLANVQAYAWLLVLVSLGIGLLGISLFVNGCWQYMVYWLSLCRNAQQAFEDQPLDLPGAYAEMSRLKKGIYVRWLALVFVLLPGLPWLPWCILLFFAFMFSGQPALILMAAVLSMISSGVLGLVWLIAQVLLSYGIQVLALEPVSSSIVAVMKRSVSLILQRPWLTLGLQVSLFLCTSYILPTPAVFLLRFSHLTVPLDNLHGWLGATVWDNWKDAMPPETQGEIAQKLMQLLSTDGHVTLLSLAQGVTDSVLGMVISLLLLPLGTIAFTGIYLYLNSAGVDQAQAESGLRE